MAKKIETKKWKDQEGQVIGSANGFDIIDNKERGYAHIIPIPTADELENVYKHDYYEEEKPLYLERYLEDIHWWNATYTQRFEIFEKHLSKDQRSILDIGSGPGYFLLNGKDRGWKVRGIEPSIKAFEHSKSIGLDVQHGFFTERTANDLGKFDAINLGLVLEHIPEPAEMLELIHQQLNDEGLICVVVPNDFNPFQQILHEHLDFDPWWIAPPHHINYFTFKSLAKLLEKCGFSIVHQESTFPIDLFLLMGDNYIGDDAMGRKCHTKRMNFENSLRLHGASDLLEGLYSDLAKREIGREIVMYAKKPKNKEFISK